MLAIWNWRIYEYLPPSFPPGVTVTNLSAVSALGSPHWLHVNTPPATNHQLTAEHGALTHSVLCSTRQKNCVSSILHAWQGKDCSQYTTFEKALAKIQWILKNILDSRMKLSLGIGQMGDETFLAPSGTASHYSHHSQSPSNTVMRKMRHGGRQSLKYYIFRHTPAQPRDNFILLCRIFFKILLNFCESFIKSCNVNHLSL